MDISKHGMLPTKNTVLDESPPFSPDSFYNSPKNAILDRPPRNIGKLGDLRSVQEIPSNFRHIFSKFPYFNIIQSKVMDDLLYTNNSIVVSAPTGSGKTVIFELAIINLLMCIENIQYHGDFKIVYMAPMKSLCSERLVDWHEKFSQIGLRCIEITGDSDKVEFTHLESFRVIITTPEKWDSLTRKWKDNKTIVELVKLFMIDEIHLLNSSHRGPTLEAVVSRMKTIQDSLDTTENSNENKMLHQKIRFIAVSATITNIEDIAEWLGSDSSAKYFSVGDEYRPVKLQKIVLGYPCSYNWTPFKFDLSLNYKLHNIINQYSDNKPTLIFCSTRKGIQQAVDTLFKTLTFNFSYEQKNKIIEIAQQFLDKKLKDLVKNGIGYHHAGMFLEDKIIIEDLFRMGLLPVLLTTSTLSMGVNLPAHLVIIKSTQIFQSGGYTEYTEIEILQMIGRAGRPQFDTSAVAVIMTKSTNKEKYEKLVGGKQLIESSLHKHLSEHLNAEVVLQTITDLSISLKWIRTTFLYVRVLKNPKYYGFQATLTKEQIETSLKELCQVEINMLKKIGMLETNEENGDKLTPTKTGELMAKYYLALETMKLLIKIKGNESLAQILNIISQSYEFSDIPLRVSDKKTLNALNKCKNKQSIRFSLPGKIKTRDMKINCIIQAVLGCLTILDFSLKQESIRIFKIGQRIANCISEYLTSNETCYEGLKNSLILSKCLHARLWENSKYVSRQLEKIGPSLSTLLVSAGKTTFSTIVNCNPRDLERIINKIPPMGNQIINAADHLPQYTISVKLPPLTATLPRYITVYIKIENQEKINELSTAGRNHWISLLIGDSDNCVLFYERFSDSYILQNTMLTKEIKLNQKKKHSIHCHVISETWVGIDTYIQVSIPPVSSLLSAIAKEENNKLPFVTLKQQMEQTVFNKTVIKSNNKKNDGQLHPSSLIFSPQINKKTPDYIKETKDQNNSRKNIKDPNQNHNNLCITTMNENDNLTNEPIPKKTIIPFKVNTENFSFASNINHNQFKISEEQKLPSKNISENSLCKKESQTHSTLQFICKNMNNKKSLYTSKTNLDVQILDVEIFKPHNENNENEKYLLTPALYTEKNAMHNISVENELNTNALVFNDESKNICTTVSQNNELNICPKSVSWKSPIVTTLQNSIPGYNECDLSTDLLGNDDYKIHSEFCTDSKQFPTIILLNNETNIKEIDIKNDIYPETNPENNSNENYTESKKNNVRINSKILKTDINENTEKKKIVISEPQYEVKEILMNDIAKNKCKDWKIQTLNKYKEEKILNENSFDCEWGKQNSNCFPTVSLNLGYSEVVKEICNDPPVNLNQPPVAQSKKTCREPIKILNKPKFNLANDNFLCQFSDAAYKSEKNISTKSSISSQRHQYNFSELMRKNENSTLKRKHNSDNAIANKFIKSEKTDYNYVDELLQGTHFENLNQYARDNVKKESENQVDNFNFSIQNKLIKPSRFVACDNSSYQQFSHNLFKKSVYNQSDSLKENFYFEQINQRAQEEFINNSNEKKSFTQANYMFNDDTNLYIPKNQLSLQNKMFGSNDFQSKLIHSKPPFNFETQNVNNNQFYLNRNYNISNISNNAQNSYQSNSVTHPNLFYSNNYNLCDSVYPKPFCASQLRKNFTNNFGNTFTNPDYYNQIKSSRYDHFGNIQSNQNNHKTSNVYYPLEIPHSLNEHFSNQYGHNYINTYQPESTFYNMHTYDNNLQNCSYNEPFTSFPINQNYSSNPQNLYASSEASIQNSTSNVFLNYRNPTIDTNLSPKSFIHSLKSSSPEITYTNPKLYQ